LSNSLLKYSQEALQQVAASQSPEHVLKLPLLVPPFIQLKLLHVLLKADDGQWTSNFAVSSPQCCVHLKYLVFPGSAKSLEKFSEYSFSLKPIIGSPILLEKQLSFFVS